jgi:wobble nucleotide-excising tRNase
LDDATRDKLLIQHRSTVKPTVPEVAYRLPAIEQLRDEVVNVLATTVTSSALEALKDDPQLGDWTRHGLGLHKNRKSEVCMFCEQPLPAGRLAALEAHFSTEYDRFLHRVDELVGRLKAAAKQASDVRPPDRAALYEDMTAEYDSAEQALRLVIEKLRGRRPLQALEQRRQPFEPRAGCYPT